VKSLSWSWAYIGLRKPTSFTEGVGFIERVGERTPQKEFKMKMMIFFFSPENVTFEHPNFDLKITISIPP
jgi:hypothetical protein